MDIINYIPIPSNFFLLKHMAEEKPAYFTIEEVYHSSPALTLKNKYFGLWNDKHGLTATSAEKWARRSDLTGVLIRGTSNQVGKHPLHNFL